MAEHRIELFAAQSRFTKHDAEELWVREAGMDAAEARRRASELLLVAVSGGGELLATCTVALRRDAQLGMDLWHLHVLVAAAHRRGGIGGDLAQLARDELGRRWVAMEDRRGGGVVFAVGDPALQQALPLAVWPRLGAVFLGRDERGRERRVHCFPGAPVPEPWPEVAALPAE